MDQQLPNKMLLEAAYVGNHAENMPIGGQALSGGGFSEFDNVNKVPLGAFFKPDPLTGLRPQTPRTSPSSATTLVAIPRVMRRRIIVRTASSMEIMQSTFWIPGYSNYDALQLALRAARHKCQLQCELDLPEQPEHEHE